METILNLSKAALFFGAFFIGICAFGFAVAMIGYQCHPEASGEPTVEELCEDLCTHCYFTGIGGHGTWRECSMNQECYESCLRNPSSYLDVSIDIPDIENPNWR